MKLSVIVPCLNAEATLAVQLEALAVQQWAEPWELVIVDNGSRDRSISIASQFARRVADFKIIDASDKKSAAYARNSGVLAAGADALAFCDADDEVEPGWVARMGEALQEHDIVYGQFRFDKFNASARAVKAAQRWKDGLFKGRFLPGGGTGNLGIKKWVHEAVGGFDESLPRFEDADYFWRLQLEGFKLHYVPQAVVQVRINRVNRSLRFLQRRGRHRTAANYWLYKRYRKFGMHPPPPLKNSLAAWIGHLGKLIGAGFMSRPKRGEWLQIFAQQTGSLIGELQGRITNPCEPYLIAKRRLNSSKFRSAPGCDHAD